MRLSTAMLKGSKGRRQCTNQLRDSEGAVCALGAACYGAGITPRLGGEFSQALTRRFPFLKYVTVQNDNGDVYELQTIIASRNDDDNWGFRKIASWLRKLGF